jgi:hypothetical protein
MIVNILDGIKRSMRVKYLRNMVDGGALSKDIKIEVVPKKLPLIRMKS